MNVGLGLPISAPEQLLSWAAHAEAGPFSTVALLDRLVYDNPEPLVTLAALAGATSRIRVQTEVLLAAVREPALLAKQTATLDRVSGGRFTFGIGVGNREEDHLATGIDFHTRGRRLDEQLSLMRGIWAGESYREMGPVGPSPARTGGPEVLFGGFAKPALERVARFGDGFLGAAPLSYTDSLFRDVERLWDEAGRSGRPRLVAQVNAALGPDSVAEEARGAAHAYYGAGDYADDVVAGILTTPEEVAKTVTAFGDLGADEVMLYCWARDPGQVARLADALS